MKNTASNPLLKPSQLKHRAVPFDQIRPEHFVPALESAIQEGQSKIEQVKTLPASFENTLIGLEIASEPADYVSGIFQSILSANSSEDLQNLLPEMGPKRAAFSSDIWLDLDIFKKVKEVYDNRHTAGLSGERLFFAEKIYRDFVKSGVNLPEDKKNRLREIDQRLSTLFPQFRQNVTRASNQFELWITDLNEVPGLPQSAIDGAKSEATSKGKPDQWLFNLQMPSYIPFLKYCANRSLREKVSLAAAQRALGGEFDNRPIILEEIALAKEKANILGFKTYADLILDDRMAENPKTVNMFLERLVKASKAVAEKELAEVADLARKVDGITTLQAWDSAYYGEKLKKEKYAFDEDQLRPYFKLENVIKGAFTTASKLYDLEFVPSKEYPTYHSEVEVFEVYKKSSTGEFIGLLYADFFPRAAKNSGAWMTSFKEQMLVNGKLDRPHVGIVCNFTKPTTEKPSLLSFMEVETLFHEFGHALHGLLSKCEIRSLAGTNVYWDFVELPSQIMENWLQEEETLRLFARHYLTNETMPKELIEKLQKSELFMIGSQTLRQAAFAVLDMAWFTVDPATVTDVVDFEVEITAPTQVLPRMPGTSISTGFAHIFGGGYSSGYYSYHWAEALDADAFEYFKEEGIFSSSVAKKFEEHILSKGGSDHPMKLYEKFRGRKPDPEALLRRKGLNA